jgi:prevent-host-death family protein
LEFEMGEIGVFEARNSLSALIDRAEKGEEITITRNGKPVAKLVAARPVRDVAQAKNALERLRRRREAMPKDALEGTSIKEMIKEGRL